MAGSLAAAGGTAVAVSQQQMLGKKRAAPS